MNFARMTMLAAVAVVMGAAVTTPVAAQKAPPAKTSAEKAPTKKKSAKKAPSPCAGLARPACSANKQCGWITPKKKVSSNGRKLTAYCRKVAGIAKKKTN